LSWIITLPSTPVSGNVVMRMHFRAYREVLKGWFWKLRAADGFKDIPKPTGKRKLTIQIHGLRLMDKENRYFACKPMVDVLRPPKIDAGIYKTGAKKGQVWTRERIGHGLVLDDDDAHLDLQVPPIEKLLKGGKPYIVLTFEDISNG